MTTVNIILLIVAAFSQVVVITLYLNSHFKGPLLDPLDYYLLRRKLPKLFSYGVTVTYVKHETRKEADQIVFQGSFERPATIFEKSDFLKSHLSLKLRSKRFRSKLSAAIDDYAEKLALDEEYSDGQFRLSSPISKTTTSPTCN